MVKGCPECGRTENDDDFETVSVAHDGSIVYIYCKSCIEEAHPGKGESTDWKKFIKNLTSISFAEIEELDE